MLAAQAFSEAAARLLTQEDLRLRASTIPPTGPSAVSRVDGLRPGSHFLPMLGCFVPRDSAGRHRECNRERDRDHHQCTCLCHFIPPFTAGDVIKQITTPYKMIDGGVSLGATGILRRLIVCPVSPLLRAIRTRTMP
jgi:hypothetical protein